MQRLCQMMGLFDKIWTRTEAAQQSNVSLSADCIIENYKCREDFFCRLWFKQAVSLFPFCENKLLWTETTLIWWSQHSRVNWTVNMFKRSAWLTHNYSKPVCACEINKTHMTLKPPQLLPVVSVVLCFSRWAWQWGIRFCPSHSLIQTWTWSKQPLHDSICTAH